MNALTSGNDWVLKGLLLSLGAGLLLSFAPSVVVHPKIELPPAYALKARAPFADTSRLKEPPHDGERLHGAKLTSRLTGSVLLWASRRADVHPYWPATLFGLLFLTSGIVVAGRITGDRESGIWMGLLFSGLYASSACFSVNWMPKPFDGIALGFIALSAMFRARPWLLFFSSLAAYWTDERAIEGMLFLGWAFFVWPSENERHRTKPLFAMGAALAAYLVGRLLLFRFLGWQAPDTRFMSPPLRLAAVFAQLAAWTALEGGWLLVVAAAAALIRKEMWGHASLQSALVLLAIVSSLFVLDVSRVGAFAFPLVLSAVALLKQAGMPSEQLRRLISMGAVISLLAPNYEIIAGMAVKWLPPLPAYLIQS